jgi:hypothetical protein
MCPLPGAASEAGASSRHSDRQRWDASLGLMLRLGKHPIERPSRAGRLFSGQCVAPGFRHEPGLPKISARVHRLLWHIRQKIGWIAFIQCSRTQETCFLRTLILCLFFKGKEENENLEKELQISS